MSPGRTRRGARRRRFRYHPTSRRFAPSARVAQLVEAALLKSAALRSVRVRIPPRASSVVAMCRNIRTLYNFEPPATDDEVRAAALQYVRKISGFTKPSQANAESIEIGVETVAEVSARLLGELETAAPPKDREAEAAKARARARERYAA